MAKGNRIIWRWTDKDGARHTTSRRPAKSRVGSGRPRGYGDFRDYADVGGGLEALIPPGDTRATSDPEVAEHLASERADELRKAKRSKVVLGVQRTARLKEFASEHLETKARTEDVTDGWLRAAERHLSVACDYFGDERELASIRPSHVQGYLEHLMEQPNRRGGTLSNQTVRHYLNSLSNLFRRAVAEELVLQNPVAALITKPTPDHTESDWLEAHEMALLLEAARLHDPRTDDGAIPFVYPLVAMFALTGGRKSEILGLMASDVDFDRKTVRIRPHEHRRLKSRTSNRTIPLWPQLADVLRPYASDRIGLLFPNPRSGKMLRDIRKQLDAVADAVGFEEGRIRTRLFRHTYTAARLQTLDGGQPVSTYTVARELGHSSRRMVERVYSHLGQIRYRSEQVEYRADEFPQIEEQVEALREASCTRVRDALRRRCGHPTTRLRDQLLPLFIDETGESKEECE